MKVWSWIAAAVVACGVTVAAGGALPAAADEGDCVSFIDAPDHWEGDIDTTEYFSPPVETVPPPLRPFVSQSDCAVKSIDQDVPPTAGTFGYSMHFVDVDYQLYVEIMRSFRDAGWFEDDELNARQLEQGTNAVLADGMSVDDLAVIDPDPWIIQAQFLEPEGTVIQTDYSQSGAGAANDLSSLTVTVAFGRVWDVVPTGSSFADPSVLSALRTIGDAVPNPTQTAVLGGAAVVLMLIVGFPGVLLNSVISRRYDQWANAVRERLVRRPRTAGGEHIESPRSARAWLVWPGFLAAAIIAGFVDPRFGFNGMSARMLITGLLSFAALNIAGWMLVRVLVSRSQPDAQPRMVFRWGSLTLVAVSVLLARLLDFQPGVIFGLVAGLAFAIVLSASKDAFVILVGSGFALAIAAIGWIAYSLLAPVAASAPGNVLLLTATEFASGVTIEGVATLPIALLPLLALDGAALFAWRRWVWGLAYAVGLAAFLVVMVTIPDSWGTVDADAVKWMLVLVGFGVFAIAIWAANLLATRRKGHRRVQPAAPE